MKREKTGRFGRASLSTGVGDSIRLARDGCGMTREHLAERSALNSRTLERIERGTQLPLPTTLRKIARALQTGVDNLAEGWSRDENERVWTGAVHPGVGLRIIRQEQGVSQTSAAAAAGVSTATLSRFERGFHASPLLSDPKRRVNDYPVITSDALAELLGFKSASDLTDECYKREEEL